MKNLFLFATDHKGQIYSIIATILATTIVTYRLLPIYPKAMLTSFVVIFMLYMIVRGIGILVKNDRRYQDETTWCQDIWMWLNNFLWFYILCKPGISVITISLLIIPSYRMDIDDNDDCSFMDFWYVSALLGVATAKYIVGIHGILPLIFFIVLTIYIWVRPGIDVWKKKKNEKEATH